MPSRRDFLAVAGTGVAGSLAGCLDTGSSPYSPGSDQNAEWPMPAYDRGYSSYNPDATAPRNGVTERWSTDVSGPAARPIISSDTVLVPTVEALVALDLDSGTERWRHGEERPWTGGPVVRDGTVYVGFADQRGLLALDLDTGDELWRVETTGTIMAAPTFDAGYDRLYAGDDTGRVYQIDLERGEVALRGEVFGAVTALAHHRSLLVGTESGEVYDLYPHHDQLTGLWRRKVGGSVTALATRDGGIFVGTFGGPVYRLQDGAHAGSSRWEAETGSTHLAFTSKDVIGNDGGGLKAFDEQSGDVNWQHEGRFGAAPAIAGDTIYVGGGQVGENGNGFVAAYPLSQGGLLSGSNKRWQFDVESAVMEGVAVADGAVFAVTQNVPESSSTVYALDPA